MAGEIEISALPLAGPATDVDITAGVQSGQTVKQTNSALFTYISNKLEASGKFGAGGTFTPNITSFGGVTAASGVNGLYTGNKSVSGGIISVTMNLLAESDNSGNVCSLTIGTPIAANFTDFFQAEMEGNPFIILDGEQGSPGNTGSGWGNQLYALTGNFIYFEFEVSEKNKTYQINVSYKFEIQV